MVTSSTIVCASIGFRSPGWLIPAFSLSDTVVAVSSGSSVSAVSLGPQAIASGRHSNSNIRANIFFEIMSPPRVEFQVPQLHPVYVAIVLPAGFQIRYRPMPGDLPPDQFRSAMHRTADLIADYLERVGDYPVLPPVSPGDVGRALPPSPPEQPEPVDRLLDDYSRLIEPNVTHWNHPGFLAYFAISGSGPGILGEALAAGLNVNAMLWRTSPAAVELEERVCDWLRQMIDLPPGFHGHINDTASSSSLVALAAARHRMPLEVRTKGLSGLPALTVYSSDQAHSSIDKGCIVLGIGQENVRRIATDGEFRMSVPALEEAIARDREAGRLPMAVVATAGTTSTTSVDPI